MTEARRNGPGTVVAGVLLLALGGYWAYSLVTGSRVRPSVPTSAATASGAPDLAIRTPGGEVRLADLKGRVVLVDFWATWCPPCRDSIPHIEALYRRYRDRGFEVLGASTDDSDEVIAPFVREKGMTYPVGRLADPASAGAYRVSAIPVMVLIDKQGKERWRAEGYADGIEDTVAEQIEALLRE